VTGEERKKKNGQQLQQKHAENSADSLEARFPFLHKTAKGDNTSGSKMQT